jgi:hypothetical protein
VKNFRVVVIIEHVNGPNVVIVVKMKCLNRRNDRNISLKLKFKSYLTNATENAENKHI